MNPRTIVCPIEFSSADTAVVTKALALARWHDAELHVVHARSSRVRRTKKRTNPKHADERALRDRIERYVAALNPGGVPVVSAVLSGNPVTAIAAYARRTAADLITVAQHGRRRGGFWATGAAAAALSRAVHCPTIVVPDKRAATAGDAGAPFKNIVCAIDFSVTSLRGLFTALALAQQSGGRLTLLHVLENFPYETVYSGSRAFRLIHEYRGHVERTNRRLNSLVPPDARNWCEVEAETASGVPAAATIATASARQADLIVMGLRRRPMLERLVLGSTVKKVAGRAPCPVLLVPGPVASATDVIGAPYFTRSSASDFVAAS